jgi:hypothetical protein
LEEQKREMAASSSTSAEGNTTVSTDLNKVFDDKYTEFGAKLTGVLPELASSIQGALALNASDRVTQFMAQVAPHCSPTRDGKENPGTLLPGVTLTDALWTSLGEKSQSAIQEYLTVLGMCAMYINVGPEGTQSAWSESLLGDMKEKLGGIDFASISSKIAGLVGNFSPDKLPKLPERFMKGHLAKLAEELVREFKPEDFGLSAEELGAAGADPMKAFSFLTDIYTKKPDFIQKAMVRIASRLQEKVRRGEIRPEQIAAEAEELIKEFSGNSSFVEMMENIRGAFGMEDPDLARQVGRDGDARRNMVRERLRKKMDAKKAGKK